MYTAIELSKYIVSKCIHDGQPITNLQLQKILYYIQKEFLIQNDFAFPDDIEAWQFGPVVPSVYYHFCNFGAMPIFIPYSDSDITETVASIVDPIVESKRLLKPWDMVEETHKPNGAWAQIYQEGLGNHTIIPTSLIKEAG